MSKTIEFPQILPAYFTIPQAATFSALSDDSIRKLLSAGKLTPFRPVGGRTLISRIELENMMRASANAACRRGEAVVRYQKNRDE